MLMGNKDDFNCTLEEAKQLYDLIESDSKDLFFYESGHQLPEEHVTKAVEWFFKYL